MATATKKAGKTVKNNGNNKKEPSSRVKKAAKNDDAKILIKPAGSIGEGGELDHDAVQKTAKSIEPQEPKKAVRKTNRAIAAGFGRAPRPEAAEQARRTLTDPQSRWAASMMRDIERGALRVEAEHIVGDLIRRGRQAGVAAPLLEAAYCHLQVYNARGAVR